MNLKCQILPKLKTKENKHQNKRKAGGKWREKIYRGEKHKFPDPNNSWRPNSGQYPQMWRDRDSATAPGQAGASSGGTRCTRRFCPDGWLQHTHKYSDLPDDPVLLPVLPWGCWTGCCNSQAGLPLSFWRRLRTDEAELFSLPVTDLHSITSLLCLVVFFLSKERCCKTV